MNKFYLLVDLSGFISVFPVPNPNDHSLPQSNLQGLVPFWASPWKITKSSFSYASNHAFMPSVWDSYQLQNYVGRCYLHSIPLKLRYRFLDFHHFLLRKGDIWRVAINQKLSNFSGHLAYFPFFIRIVV